MGRMDMRYEYALEMDYNYIYEKDKHVSKELIKTKIHQKEIIIARDINRNIGWLRYGYFWDNIPFMNMLYIEEEYRRKGIGTGLVKFWEDEMKMKGYNLVMTSSLANEQAQFFFRKLGYNDSGCLLLNNQPLEIIFTKYI
jgi:ribosomal protein S18 acetylase RimI-like enzyme